MPHEASMLPPHPRSHLQNTQVPLRVEKGYFSIPSGDLYENWINIHLSITLVETLAMEHHNEFIELLKEIISRDPEPIMSEEEIHFDVLVTQVMEQVGDHVVWLN